MDLEKIVNSRAFLFFDWIWRLFILNFLTIFTSLGIITIFPSLVACYQSIKDFDEGSTKNVFAIYFKNFGSYFKRTIIMGTFFLVVLVILGYAFYYYGDNVLRWAEEGYDNGVVTLFIFGRYFVLFCFIIILMIFIQLPMVYSNFYFRFFDNIRFAFYVTFKFILKSILSLLAWVGSYLLFLNLIPIWCFLGVSFIIFINYRISIPVYRTLININEN